MKINVKDVTLDPDSLYKLQDWVVDKKAYLYTPNHLGYRYAIEIEFYSVGHFDEFYYMLKTGELEGGNFDLRAIVEKC